MAKIKVVHVNGNIANPDSIRARNAARVRIEASIAASRSGSFAHRRAVQELAALPETPAGVVVDTKGLTPADVIRAEAWVGFEF